MIKKCIVFVFAAFTVLLITSTGVSYGAASETYKVPDPAVNSEVEQKVTENELQTKIDNLEMQVNELDRRLSNNDNKYASGGLVLFLFGSFCALWAQNTGRNALGWFFGGAIFNFISVLILLKINNDDNNPPNVHIGK